MIHVIQRVSFVFCCSVTLLALAGLTVKASTAGVSVGVGSIKGTVSATTSDASARPTLLAGARLTLVNRDLPNKPALKFVTDERGNFIFSDLPAANYLLSA